MEETEVIKINRVFTHILAFAGNYPVAAKYCTTIFRWIFVLLAMYILIRAIRSLLSTRTTPEVWGYLYVQDGVSMPISHWENLIGRSSSVDLRVPLKTVSNNHALLFRRKDGQWVYKDLDSKNGSLINGTALIPGLRYLINPGDELSLGGVKCTLASMSLEESQNNEEMRRMDMEPISPWKSMIAITIFQMLTIVQLVISMGKKCEPESLLAIMLLSVFMWVYITVFKALGRKGFEIELIAFFMSTISLAVVASSSPKDTMKQLIAVIMGIALFVFMCVYLQDLTRTKKLRPVLIILSVVLLLINLIFGTSQFGATNWVRIAGISMQPSELVKLAFICIGAATLEEMFDKRNLLIYVLFSFFCLGSLAVMGDFGTALIFFLTFVVVSFLRSGDISRMVLTLAGAGFMGMMVLKFKHHVATRFAAWGHVWEDAFVNGSGFQQTRTMTYSAGGGLLGLGAGNGSLKHVIFANTDLVFGIVTEEWGLIIAILLVLCLITLSLFAVNSIVAGRSAFYTTAACGAATLILLQTMLNVLGSVDLLPLTGVTFPLISAGGTSIMTFWAMLAYFKAADMRKDASIATGRDKNSG